MISPQVDQEKVKALRNKPGKDMTFNLLAKNQNCLPLFRFLDIYSFLVSLESMNNYKVIINFYIWDQAKASD